MKELPCLKLLDIKFGNGDSDCITISDYGEFTSPCIPVGLLI